METEEKSVTPNLLIPLCENKRKSSESRHVRDLPTFRLAVVVVRVED